MHRSACLALALLPALAGAECRYQADRNFDVPADGLRRVSFDLGSSDVVVEGVAGLRQVEVRGRACASDAAWLDGLTVDQNRSGDLLVITPHDGHDLRATSWGSNYAYVDVRVRMPATLAVAIKSVSGDAEVRNVASLDFEASSGDLDARHVSGTLASEVSSGDVRAEDVGDVDIRGTASGDVNLTDVHGPVNVARAGSGDLHLDTVGGVAIGAVGSGDIWIGNANGDVTVESVGSGDVRVDGVAGNFRVGSRGSGSVGHSHVRGTVDVPHDNDDD